MHKLDAIIQKQAIGARFVISAPMLGLSVEQFDLLVNEWQKQTLKGFKLEGTPFRKVINGQFYIQRITAIRTED